MCLAVPGKIISIQKDIALVDYELETREARIVSEGYAIGDYVIVQGKIVITKVPTDEAEAWLTQIRNSR